jgi:predicted metalloprotease with PDZ domain
MLKKSLTGKFTCILWLLLFSLSVRSQADAIKCTLNLKDRMLDVKIDVPPTSLAKTSFSLTDWAGQANYAEDIYRVSASDRSGNSLNVKNIGARTWIVENAKKAFELAYTVVSQKDFFMGDRVRNQFHPTLFKNYAFLWGRSFLFYPDDADTRRLPVRLRIVPNDYVNVYSNFGGMSTSFEDLRELFIAAGDYRVLQKMIGGRKVKFLIQGKKWKFSDEQFAATVSQIIDAQVKYMGFSPPSEDLLITLTEGTRTSKGGTVVKNVISVYPSPETSLRDFDTLKLISHENFHYWNGIYWHPANDKKEGYYKWMSEGFTDYYAGLTLYREDLISTRQFIDWLNGILLDYQTNPIALQATADVLLEKYRSSDDYNHLPYLKGALIALLTDLKIRQETGGKKQIDDLMKRLMSKTDSKKGYDDELLLAGFDSVTQISNRQFYDDYILGAGFLPITESLKKSGIAVSEQPQEVFDLGFTTETGLIERGVHVKEVVSKCAVESGLKPGDEIRGLSFMNGRPNEEASITVQRESKILQIRYFPMKTINVLQISENAPIPK